MSDREHSHEHDNHGHHCHHDGHDEGPLSTDTDPGSRSLTDALRVSFVLLAVIMAFMIFGFLMTGMQSIESNEVGIVKVFGSVVRTARPGLTYNWPFPIGEIEIVKMDEQRLTIRDFWINEPPGEAEKPLSQRRSHQKGSLRPGWDGALLTGDRYLLHMRIECRYAVENAPAFRRWVRDAYAEKLPGQKQARQVDPKEETVRSAVCSAAITAAASRTADGLQTSDRREFTREVERLANETLRGESGQGESTGLKIRRIVLAESTWPLLARADYDKVLVAKHGANEARNTAISQAEKILRDTAGEEYTQLVGRPSDLDDKESRVREFVDTSRATAQRAILSCLSSGVVTDSWPAHLGLTYSRLVLRSLIPKVKPYDLIGKYSDLRNQARIAARRAKSETVDANKAKALEDQVNDLENQARRVLDRIDEVLLGNDIKGQARKDIREARGEANRIKSRVLTRLKRYKNLLSKNPKVRKLTMERIWAEAREEVLAAAAEKYYVTTGQGKTIIRINRDPRIVAAQVRKGLEASRNAREEKQKKKNQQ